MQKLFRGFPKMKQDNRQILPSIRFLRGRTLFILLLVLGAVLLIVSGCTMLFAGNTVSEPFESGSTLFSDDFSEELSGWGVWDREGGSVMYDQDGLRIVVNETQFDYWSVAGRNFGDVQVDVDAKKLAGSNDNDFGIICRYLDKNNFYMLVISSDGYYGIAKVSMGQYSMIGADQLQYSSAIAQDSRPNHLRADCVGSTLRLYANGQLLMEAKDKDFTSGDVGLLAGAYDESGVDVLFDNFVVKKP